MRRFLLPSFSLLLLLFLSSCSGHTTRVIETPETRELEGWQKPYEVDGQRYQPLRDHQGFQQRGIASWYGRKFHGRKTSNGEVYDMYAVSAAHKTLPMGVYVKVTHLGNGRHVIVRINDRGPFVAGRIIDLSYGAAKQLGIVESGTAQVQLQALGYRSIDASKTTTFSSPGNYDSGSFAVQIAAFSTSSNAYNLVGKVDRQYGQATVSAGIRNGQKMYRVRVGNFTSLEQAEQAAKNLARGGFSDSYVVAFE
ncbi:rare lipoprotein A [Desulfuromusa kysingii]|uniref:Probable endolytic peptidoglycan transglycosylase RlpA n=1 Tax=Desulfuromusa kysingii TaxID=37625 RepID=A0A1H3Y645_9BACT|nr:septal ring lytic transglycosylase RlpA family protein [Desulfuromusa kysingii]SEA07053.1 rare lipoprotein A [Desulfuromusa kysingii]